MSQINVCGRAKVIEKNNDDSCESSVSVKENPDTKKLFLLSKTCFEGSMQALYQKKRNRQKCKILPLINPLSANPTKWSNTLKQFVGNLANELLECV